MNYKPLIKDKFLQLMDENPDYTFGQVLYSFLTSTEKGKGKDRAYLIEIEDVDFYSAIDKAIKKERDE